jgi:hypothetical protein
MSETQTFIDEVLTAEEETEAAEAADDDRRGADDSPEDRGVEEEVDPAKHDWIDEGDESLLDPEEDRRAPGLTRISEILGVPLFYERGQPAARRSFFVAESFVPVLEATVKQIRERVPASFGQLQQISTAGMFVDKPGRHGEGKACDWDRLVFANTKISPLEREHDSATPAKRRRYWAVAAICRSNSCFVLHGFYDAAHRDHIHTDHSTGVGFNRAESTVKLTQAVLNNMFGEQLVVDGDFGTNTRQALTRALSALDLPDDIGDTMVWRRFLRRSARLGFTAPG